MRVTRFAEAPLYVAPLHHDVRASRLQGHEAGPTGRFWVGISDYPPGGHAEQAPTREETVYVVLDGEIAVTADGREEVLGRHDSVHLPKGEVRAVHNRGTTPATMLVVIAHPEEPA